MNEPQTNFDRSGRFSVLANAPTEAFHQCWNAMGRDPSFELVRGPETGLISLRGRMGGGGAPFPFGDATATRASVRLEDGRIGHAMLLGRDSSRVTIAAVIDALCNDENDAMEIDRKLIAPLAEAISQRDAKRSAQTVATKVDFFTMVRGED